MRGAGPWYSLIRILDCNADSGVILGVVPADSHCAHANGDVTTSLSMDLPSDSIVWGSAGKEDTQRAPCYFAVRKQPLTGVANASAMQGTCVGTERQGAAHSTAGTFMHLGTARSPLHGSPGTTAQLRRSFAGYSDRTASPAPFI